VNLALRRRARQPDPLDTRPSRSLRVRALAIVVGIVAALVFSPG
jgi:hypothetical protein